jgi:predicted flap endonuclease-1-like 5' DNA nuclease
MTEDNYRKAIRDAEEEIVKQTLYRASADRKITQLKAAITALSALLEQPPKVDDSTTIGDVGITNAIRQVLKEAGVGLTPAQVKAKLIEAEFDLDKYANSSAVIHNTLKRLEAQGQVVSVRDSSGVTAYAVNSSSSFGEGIARAMKEASLANHPSALTSFAGVTGELLGMQHNALTKHLEEAERMGKQARDQFEKALGGLK